MRLFLCFSILLFIPALGYGQVIEAVNEDSSRQIRFRLNEGVECEVNVANRPVVVRGKVVLINSTNFRLKLSDGIYTTVLLDDLIRMRRRRYAQKHLAATSTGSGFLVGSTISRPSLATVAVSALTGLGMALASGQASFRHKDPSIYRGWMFKAVL